MANKNLFASQRGKLLPTADALNEAGGRVYRLPPEQALAQYAATGCLNGVFYADAHEQLSVVLALLQEVSGEFAAKCAVYARSQAHMKDMPALIAAALSVKAPQLLPAAFGKVIDNGRMLRTFVQILRSGAVGRKSLGTLPKRLVQQWLERASDKALLNASVGRDPSLADIVKMVHPKPVDAEREALYGYLIGRPVDAAKLPESVRAFEAFKRDGGDVPEVNFQLLTGLPLTTAQWTAIAANAGWQMTRMNLNTFARHGVFEAEGLTELISARLRDAELVGKARAFPYQVLVAYLTLDVAVPAAVKEALQDALEASLANVPAIEGRVVVLPDVSGSMGSPVTGQRGSGTTAVTCRDVAALFAAALVSRNRDAEVLPFDDRLHPIELNPRDSVVTNAARLAATGGGGTHCSLPLAVLNQRGAKADVVIYVSDNQSWIDSRAAGASETMRQWEAFKQRNPQAKLVCLDLQPYGTTIAAERDDVLNIGGFADNVFGLIGRFVKCELEAAHWVAEIERIVL